ncbi:hypothetical protein ACET3Z_018445 [Daucus carota]
MMAGSEGDVGGYKGLEGETELCSHQDLVNCGGNRFEGDGNGKGNVGDDLGGSYVFVSGVGEVRGGFIVEGNSDGEVRDGVELKGDGGGGIDHDFAAEVDKEVDLHGEFVGEVVESVASGEGENGKDDFEGTVEGGVEFETRENLEAEAGNGLEIGESEGIFEDRVKFESGEDSESRDGNGLEIGESGVTVIVSVGDGELLDKSIKDVDQNIVVSVSEVGESEQVDMIGMGASECGLGKLDAQIGEEVSQEPTKLKSVVGDVESQIRISADPLLCEFEKDQNNLKQIKDLSSDAELIQSQEGVIKLDDTNEIDKSVKAVEQDLIGSPADFEGNRSNTFASWADICELEEIQAGIELDIGDGDPKEQNELNSVKESLKSEIRITESVNCASHDLEENQDKSKHMTDLDSEIDGSVQLGSQTNAVADEGVNCTAAADDFIVGRDKDLDECIDGSQSVDKQDSTLSDAANLFSMDKVPIESGEKFTAGTDDCEAAEHEASRSVVAQEIGAVNSTELDSNITKTYAESIGHVPAKIFGSRFASIDDGTVSDQGPVDADCGAGLVQEYEEERVAHDIDTRSVRGQSKISPLNLGEQRIVCTQSLELNGNPDDGIVPQVQSYEILQSDCNDATITEDGKVSDQGPDYANCRAGLVQGYEAGVAHDTDTRSVTDQCNISQLDLGEQRSDCTQSPELNGNPEDAHDDCIVPQVQSDDILCSDCNDATIIEPEVRRLVCPIIDKSELETKPLDTKDLKTGIFSVTNGRKFETGVDNGLSSCAPNDMRSVMKIEFGTIDSPEEVIESGYSSLSESQVLNGDIECNQKQAIFTTDSVESESCADMSFKTDVQNHSAMNHSDMPCQDSTVAKRSIGDSVDGQSLVNVAKAKPFQFLAKFPRIDDDKIREQIRDSQLLVEDKTVLRDNIKREIDITRASLQSLRDEFEATKSDERAARRLVKLKRQEIDSVQDKINRVKNSVSVMDITNRIAHMEHMMEHETRPLKEEMQLLHEINVMKKLRGQISSNVCSQEEVTQALNEVEPTEIQLKTLKKELGDLKNKVSKAEAAVILLGKDYNDESRRLRELQARFRAANDIRQNAYRYLFGLKRQLHEKSKHYWMYKDDAKAASDYALSRDKEALYRLCAKQVETFMDLWNKNDEFREDYVRCNMKSTLRRLKTLDGRSLGPDEEVHVLPVYVGAREVPKFYNPSRTTNLSSPTILKQENTVQVVEGEQIDGNILEVSEPKSKMLKIKTSDNPIPESGLHTGSGQLETEDTREEAKQQTKEELELAMKTEILRKEEIAAKLKEQLRQEEKVKAQEAIERKKRNADKAQMRAVLRAQKEAEQKEKEREKRLRKKEKKNGDGEIGLEPQTNRIKDESKDSAPTKPNKTSHFNKHSKAKATIPPALRNRGKRSLKQFMWWIFGGLIVLFIFLAGNGGAFKNLRSRKDDSLFGNHPPGQPIWQS